jgi:predicted naringenin-chalcone synthase
MAVYIHHIATRNPEFAYPQAYTRELMKERVGEEREIKAILHRIYSQSGIDQRYSVLPDFQEGQSEGFLFTKNGVFNPEPSTGLRNAVYTREARKLFSLVARDVIEQSGLALHDITHVITVSCTGFYAPGPDYTVVMDLGLALNTPRFHIGFMGCYAAFPALRMAKSFCEADPNARVLVVSVELCSLHLQFSKQVDAMLGASVFADGASAAIVSAHDPIDRPALRIDQMQTMLAPEGEADMAWTIGDNGFDMVLTSYVPKILEMKAEKTIQPLLEASNLPKDDVDIWAVHPGGRAIIDKVRDGMGLDESKLEHSRKVLREVGNLSSATILFVLKSILEASHHSDQTLVAMAFGPGLTIESAVMERIDATP